jgi:hypothetical protein
MNQENTNEPLSKTAVMQSVLIEELLQKIKFVLECKNETQAERILEQFIFDQEEFTIEFVKWMDKNYFQGEKHDSYAKSKEDFLNKETVFNISELYEIFKRKRLETVA